MLATVDIPDFLEEINQECKEIASILSEKLKSIGEVERLDAGTELLQMETPCYLYVVDGFFRFHSNQKLVRFYFNGDLIIADNFEHLKDCSLSSELGAEVIKFNKEEFLLKISQNIDLLNQWTRFQELENHLMHVLCSLYMKIEVRPRVRVKQFKDNEVIIKEGDDSNEVFLLVDGCAKVLVDNTRVGSIGSNEFFGEISFLTGSKRIADVLADGSCLVQIITKEEFEILIRVKPQMILTISETLAKRVEDLNQKLVISEKK